MSLPFTPAGQSGPRNFDFCRFVAGNPGVGDRDSPEPGGAKVGRRRRWIYVAGFVADFIGYARIADHDEWQRAGDSSLRRDHGDAGRRDFMGDDCDETLR